MGFWKMAVFFSNFHRVHRGYSVLRNLGEKWRFLYFVRNSILQVDWVFLMEDGLLWHEEYRCEFSDSQLCFQMITVVVFKGNRVFWIIYMARWIFR